MLSIHYLRRIFSAYVLKRNSQLSFWHETPAINIKAKNELLGSYYMAFTEKAGYSGPFDNQGIPLLDYKGKLGKQYNPIAIAQYGLGSYNLFKQNGDESCLKKSIIVADWLTDNLTRNKSGCWVWNHLFDWEYFKPLRSPWYSALAQGQGISALLRIHSQTGDVRYKDAADKAFKTLMTPINNGGVLHIDSDGYWWLEEYIVNPPTHILNGFIWALWGVYDYMKLTNDNGALELWNQSLKTLSDKLSLFDNGYWSLYDLSKTSLSNVASYFYHSLHIVQLRIMADVTGDNLYQFMANRWESYKSKYSHRKRALAHKAIFKILYF